MSAPARLVQLVADLDAEAELAPVDGGELTVMVTVIPTSVPARWATSTRVPTVAWPGARYGCTASMAVRSMSRIMSGVDSTRSGSPRRWAGVMSSVTVTVATCLSPTSSFLSPSLIGSFLFLEPRIGRGRRPA